jgi:hypothetical protein
VRVRCRPVREETRCAAGRSSPMRSRRPTQSGRSSSVGPTAWCAQQRCPVCPSVPPQGTRRMPCVPRPVQVRGGKDGRAVQRKTAKARTRAARAHTRTYTRTRAHAPAHTLAPAYEPHGDVDGRALEYRSSVARQVKLVEGDDDDDDDDCRERPPKRTQARSGARGGSTWDAAHGVVGHLACRNSCPLWGPLRARRIATLCRSIVRAGSRHARRCMQRA